MLETVNDELGAKRRVGHGIYDKVKDLKAWEDFNKEGRGGKWGFSESELSDELFDRWKIHSKIGERYEDGGCSVTISRWISKIYFKDLGVKYA